MKKILLIITTIISAFTINAAQLTSVAATNSGENFNYSNWVNQMPRLVKVVS